MKKVALVFVLAVFVPSLLLAWLAVRSLRDQQFILERQQSLLYQGVADAKAKEVQDVLTEYQHSFTLQVAKLLGKRNPQNLAGSFDDLLRKDWPLAQVGFSVSLAGEIKAPSLYGRSEARKFLDDNGRFLANRESVDVYLNQKQALANVNVVGNVNAQPQSPTFTPPETHNEITRQSTFNKSQPRNVYPQQAASAFQNYGTAEQAQQQISKASAAPAEFRQLIGDDNEGALARFVDNKLNVLVWYRPPGDSQLVFGAQLALPRLVEGLGPLVRQVDPALRDEICVALLDDNAKPVALSHPGFRATWKRPFVATEIGETLPHWEVAVYLLNPAKLTQSAHTLKLTLGLLIGVLLLAIGIGSWLIVTDLNRQLTLARQKTDFVSNVSHELKTPLTSIRMFSELLAEGRVTDKAKQRSYLGIITAETARLTRLINNVLDFARIERGEKKYNFQKCDLVNVVRDTADTYRPHLEANGFQFACDLPGSPAFVNGDRDAVAQVVVNLLSNAEKYSDSRKEIALHVEAQTRPLNLSSPESCRLLPLSPSEGERAGVRGPSSPGGSAAQGALPVRGIPSFVEIKVLDRGLGVPAGCGEKIFEQFYRAHDSLSNGIQGSGLGLTLARQIARAHGGDVVYEPRDGGGSCFTLRLPLLPGAPDSTGPRAVRGRCRAASTRNPRPTQVKTKVLIVEDDPHILLGLEEVLKSDGFDVAVCNRGDQAMDAVRKHRPTLIVLDVMLPGLSGYDICKQLRAKKVATPILMLTAKGQEIDKVVGLDLGADDYVTKPFGVRELLARIHALLRRTASAPSTETNAQAPFQIGAATIDPKTFQLKRQKEVEELTPKELKLLQLFAAHPGEVFSRDRLLNEVWGYNYYGTTRTLDQVIVQLRKKLGDNGDDPKHLLTVHGVGYKLVV